MEVVSESGRALRDLVASFMSLERRPYEEVAFRKSVVDTEVSAQKKLASRLSSLRRLTQDFSASGALSPFRGFKVSGLESTSVRASTSSTALSGSHQLEVRQLAQTHSLASKTITADASGLVALPTLEPATVHFSIDHGGDEPTVFEIELKPEMTNREVIRAAAEAINRGTTDLAASVVQTSSNEVRLLIQTRGGGKDARIRSISDVDGSIMSALGMSGGETDGLHHATVQAPQDAELTLDGLEIRGASNQLKNVLSGVDLNLDAVTEGTIEFEVERDDEGVSARVQAFLDSYNESLDEILTLTRAADEDGRNRGILASSSTFRSLRFAMRTKLTAPVMIDGRQQSLEQIGIIADRNGKLSLKASTFTNALQSNPNLVEDIFSGEGGVATRLETLLDGYARTGGILDQQVEASERRVGLFTRRMQSIEISLAKREENLLTELAAMQSLIGTLSSQQSYLGSLFG